MQVETILGEYCNVYLINSNINILVDAGASISELPQCDIQAIVLTHAHYDHLIYLVDYLTKFPKARVYMSKRAYEKHSDTAQTVANLFGATNLRDIARDRVVFVDENCKIDGLNESHSFINLFGHTDCSIGLIINDCLFCGDAVFENGYGRYDLPTGNREQTFETLDKIKNLKNIKHIYSGHGTPFDVN